jgi:Fe-S-cluster containining protein
MPVNFDDIFSEYEALVGNVETVFAAVRERCPQEVRCAPGCSDCCQAIFDLSLVEAMYLNKAFNERLEKDAREAILARADEAERKQHKLVRKTVKAHSGENEDAAILDELARQRIRCPLLDAAERCELYGQRPITCRLYGIPTSIGGEAHTCGLSGFAPGAPYPTVQLEKIQDRLMALSLRIQERVLSRYSGLAAIHVPVASALINTYDKEYLGSRTPEEVEADRRRLEGKAPSERAGRSSHGPQIRTLGGEEE